ncbi:MAG: YbaK/EbsC family protein [Chloroflexi bacterium]|nr:MAG: YbaK/EbsC family protein [Chloroflexota bacterium]
MAPGRVGDDHTPPRSGAAIHHAPLALTADHPNIARVRAYAAERGVELVVKRFAATTRTAEDAAREIGTEVRRIVKSLVFIADGRPVLVLCCGDNRVSVKRLEDLLRARSVRRATADEAKAHTGFPIGGVPPFAHARSLDVIADQTLARFDRVWAAAGLPDAVFEIAREDLERLTGARRAAIAAIPGME